MHTYDFNKIEIIGVALQSFFGGLGSFQSLADKILCELEYGSRREDGTYYFESDRWYPAGPNLEMFAMLKDKIGPNTLRQVGRRIPEQAIFPPEVDTIEKGLASIDVAYHMNHGQNGRPLLNPETGEMQDLIGHYRLETGADERDLKIVSDTPYPSEMDEGLVTAMARRFETGARVALDPDAPSRLRGGASCTYVVRW